LGNNCEVGIIHLANGHDAPGLFRNVAFKKMEQMILALESGFSGMFEDGCFHYTRRPNWPDYSLHCKCYGFAFHTAIPVSQPLSVDARARNISAFRYLLREFRQDLAAGDKIFVFRSDEVVQDRSVVRLHRAVCSFGAKWVLYVREDPSRSRGEVEALSEGLLLAAVPKLSNSNPPVIDMGSWDRIVQLSVLLKQSAAASSVQ